MPGVHIKSVEKVHFRLILMECCGHLLCWVGSRLPSWCPQCGQRCYPACRSWVTSSDPEAWLKVDAEAVFPKLPGVSG